MTIEEKFTGFSYQDNQKIPPRGSREIWSRSHGPRLERQKGREDEATGAFNQVFQALAQKPSRGLPVTANRKPRRSSQTFRRDSYLWI